MRGCVKNLFSDYRVIRYISLIFSVIVFVNILMFLNRGISCDEGFYLLGYQSDQEIGSSVSDFHNIIKAFFPDQDVMFYRYLRLGLEITSLMFFTISMYFWLLRKCNYKEGFVELASIIFTTGLLSFTYASPTISFDHLQHIYFNFLIGTIFLIFTIKSSVLKNSLLFLSGLLNVFLLTNNIASWVLLVSILVIYLLFAGYKFRLTHFLYITLGVITGVFFYSIFVQPFDEFFYSLLNAIAIETSGHENHDANNLIVSTIESGMIFIIAWFLLSFVFFLLNKIIKKNRLFYFLLLVLIFISYVLYSELFQIKILVFLFPISFLTAIFISDFRISKQSFEKKHIANLLLFMLLPFVGVFGTNQDIFTKMLMFANFWAMSFYLILYKHKVENYLKWTAKVFILLTAFFAYFYLANFSRYHYYYTPRSSNVNLGEYQKFNSVLVSKYQSDYYADLYNLLISQGFSASSTVLAFAENQIPIFMFGAKFHGGLVYHWHQYSSSNIHGPDFLIMCRYEEKRASHYLENYNWGFPKDYKRFVMRKMSENMEDGEFDTVIYIK